MEIFGISFGKKPDTKIKTEVVLEATPETEVSSEEDTVEVINGYSFNKKRKRELMSNINVIFNHDNKYDFEDKVSLSLVDDFSDVKEIIAFFDLNPKDCVIVLTQANRGFYSLNETAICPADIAGVFDTFEKNRKVMFPDGISDDTVLYNVIPVDIDAKKLNISKRHFDLFNIPSKIKLIKAIFGAEERAENMEIENFLLSLKVINKKDHLYFYLATRASKKVKAEIYDFKDKFFKLKKELSFSEKVYPTLPFDVIGGPFDWEKAEKNAKDGVDREIFYGHLFYERLAEHNKVLKEILEKEKKRLEFVKQFYYLENLLGRGDFAYTSIDMARYQYTEFPNLRGTKDRTHCFWDSLLFDLENLYKDELPERYSGRHDKKKQEKKITLSFYNIAKKMIFGEASSDKEVISFIKLFSKKGIQVKKDATIHFVKIPSDDCQNEELKKLRHNATIEYLEKTLIKELQNKSIASNYYKVL